MDGTGASKLGIRVAVLAVALAGCDEQTWKAAAPPAAEGEAPRVFFDDFQAGQLRNWTALTGRWSIDAGDPARKRYAVVRPEYALTIAGAMGWVDYRLSAEVTVHDDRGGPVGLAARLQSSHYHYELVLGREKGVKSWLIRRRLDHDWTVLASGPFDYQLERPQVLRFVVQKKQLTSQVSTDGGATFTTLGGVEVGAGREMVSGRIGLVSYGGRASFDDVTVINLAAGIQSDPFYGPIVDVRDDSTRYPTGKPAGGWYVVGIHGTLRASDGKVLINGWSRKGDGIDPDDSVGGCQPGETSQNATSWVFDPATFTGQNPLMIDALDEKNLDVPNADAIYCAGHTTLPDGKILIVGGSRHPGGYPHTKEFGLNYSRVFDPFDNGAGAGIGTFTRISAPMLGGPIGANDPGMKWYPTAINMPDGKVLTFGGFSFNGGGTGDRKSQAFENYDHAVWTADPNANPWEVLLQHEQGDILTTPSRGYTNLFLLPKPVPAAQGSGFARTVAAIAGSGKMFLFSHETGPLGSQRLLGRKYIRTMEEFESGEGGSGVVLPDGRIMLVNGGHDGDDSAKASFYNPVTDSWTETPPLTLGISRMFGDALWLPDGRVMIINGYASEFSNVGDISDPVGGVNTTTDGPRRTEIIDPFNMSKETLPPWDTLTTRGYHSIAVLLKDGRILLAGGKDAKHKTGCEKNELRIFSPPYLSAGPRPTTTAPQGTQMTIGGAPININYTGTIRAVRGVSLLAPGSLTHGFDMGQRYVPLAYTNDGEGGLTITPPSNPNIAPPGDYVMYLISDVGVPSLGVHVKVQAPPPCVYSLDGSAPIYLEAEKRSRQDGPFVQVTDGAASNGAYMQVTDSSGDHTTVPDEGKVMWFDLDVFTAGNYHIYLYGNAPDAGSASAWVSVGNHPDLQYTAPVGAWGWAQAGTVPLSLSDGHQSLKIKVRQDGVKIDKIALRRTVGLPTGQGGPGLVCNNSPPPAANLISTNIPSTLTPPGTTSRYRRVHTVTGAGTDIWSTADQFRFAHQALTGDGTITARVTQVCRGTCPNVWSKAAVMMRDGTAAGARYVGAIVSPTPANKFRLQYRNALNGTTTSVGSTPNSQVPAYLRVTRAGNTFTASYSTDGVTFTPLGSPQTITLPPTIQAGVGITSHTAGTAVSAVFDSISITGPTPPSPPGPPPNLMAAPGNRQVILNWTAPAGPVTSYTVKRSTTMGMGYANLQTGITATTFTDSTAANGTTYYYVVSAINGAGEGANSPEANAKPFVPAPGGFTAAPGDAQITLGWSPVTNASTYTVKRSLTMGGPYDNATFPGITMTSFVDNTVTNGTPYFYVVSALDGAAEGPNSVEKSATPAASMAPPAPTNLNATSTGNTVNLTWIDNATNETGFRVERKVNAGAFGLLTTVGMDVQGASDTPVSATNTYTYRVIAVGSPNSAPSNEVVVVVRNPDADAHVRDGTHANNNFGANTVMEVKNYPPVVGNSRQAFIRFPLTSVGTTVTSAKIRLFGTSVTSAKAIALSTVTTNPTWVEGTGTIAAPVTTTGVDWNTRPMPGVQQGSSQTAGTTGAYVEFDVTTHVQAEKSAGAANVTLAITMVSPSNEGPTTINSRENAANKPLVLISSR